MQFAIGNESLPDTKDLKIDWNSTPSLTAALGRTMTNEIHS